MSLAAQIARCEARQSNRTAGEQSLGQTATTFGRLQVLNQLSRYRRACKDEHALTLNSENKMMLPTFRVMMIAGASVGMLASVGLRAQDTPGPTNDKIDYSPYPTKNFPNRVYFGDTHLHTSYSTDAGMIGNTLGPKRRIASLAAKM